MRQEERLKRETLRKKMKVDGTMEDILGFSKEKKRICQEAALATSPEGGTPTCLMLSKPCHILGFSENSIPSVIPPSNLAICC
jgi:hypothetical protein